MPNGIPLIIMLHFDLLQPSFLTLRSTAAVNLEIKGRDYGMIRKQGEAKDK
jgi:hypothetical protein